MAFIWRVRDSPRSRQSSFVDIMHAAMFSSSSRHGCVSPGGRGCVSRKPRRNFRACWAHRFG
eukprot:scaffold380229_cov46-Prasinocladus_malaysianus.AAC.1